MAGLLCAAALGVGAQASTAAPVTLEVGIANNVFPAMSDLGSFFDNAAAGDGINAPVFGSQAGGWHRADDTTSTWRGITSGNYRKQIQGPGPYTTPGAVCSASTTTCQYGPLGSNGFFSADESNVNAVIPSGTGAGTCVLNSTTAGLSQIQACPGVNSSKTAFVIGDIAVYSCDADNATNGADPGSPGAPVGAVNGSGNGEPNSPRCEAAEFGTTPTTIDDVIGYLMASSSNKISIALPSSAPFGAASKAALEQADNQSTTGSRPVPFVYDESSGTSAQNAWPAGTGTGQCEGTLPSGAVCRVRLEAGISQVRGAVTSGTVPLGIVAHSNVKYIDFTSGSVTPDPGRDPNPFTVIPQSAYTANGPIAQYGVVLDSPDNTKDARMTKIVKTDICHSTAIQVFTQYGYANQC